jgi:hypothetical protein
VGILLEKLPKLTTNVTLTLHVEVDMALPWQRHNHSLLPEIS